MNHSSRPGNAFMRNQPLTFLCMLLVFQLVGCAEFTSPACNREYSKTGSQEAISELVVEFQKAVALVMEKDNLILLSETKQAQKDLIKMEAWTCEVHKLYGRPD